MAKISTLIDDFQDNVINTSLWTPSGTVSESGGRLVVNATSPFSYVISGNYDLRSSQITVHVPVVTPVGTSGTLQCGFAIRLDSNNIIGFQKHGNDLRISRTVAGSGTLVNTTPYNAVSHLYWRIRHTPNNVFFETSATGVGTFFIQYTEATSTLFSITAVQAYFYATFTGFESAPGAIQIEAVNPGITITASGSSTSAGSVNLLTVYKISASGASTSAGSAAINIPPAPPITYRLITASGTGTTTGSASFIILTVPEITAAGQSVSSGSATLRVSGQFTAVGQSFSTGTAALSILSVPVPDTDVTYFYFEPPIAYDLPPTLPHPRPRYLNAHARWKGGQRRGRSVLKLNGVYVTKDTPTVDETLAATEVYMGGHIYTINNITADALTAAGYVVTPIPINWTLYPGEDVYPEVNLFPGYQEFIPDRMAV